MTNGQINDLTTYRYIQSDKQINRGKDNNIEKQGQTVYRTEVVDKLDKQWNILKIRQTNIYTEQGQTVHTGEATEKLEKSETEKQTGGGSDKKNTIRLINKLTERRQTEKKERQSIK